MFNGKPERRLESATNILNNINADGLALLKKAQLKETNSKVLDIIKQGLALGALSSADANTRLSAIADVKDSLQPAIRNQLQKMTAETEPGVFAASAEKDPAVLKAAQKALKAIEGKVELYGYIERIFFGLSLGSILLLVAAGLAITFGVMGVINMAHGEFNHAGRLHNLCYSVVVTQQYCLINSLIYTGRIYCIGLVRGID